MAPQGAAYNVDWVWSNTSNTHACNHRDWFTTFTAFKSQAGSLYGNTGIDIEGVGDVELEIRRVADNKTRMSPWSTKIILRDVIYCPDAVCNILGFPIINDFDLETGSGGALREKGTGRLVGLLDSPRLNKLLLKGQSKGQTSLNSEGIYMINIRWPETEQQRWQEFKTSSGNITGGVGLPVISGAGNVDNKAAVAPYTDEEKKWLKDKYGGEFKLLRAFGLSIYKEEDREEGRTLVRDLMKAEDEAEDEDGSEDSRDSFERDLEEDPMSHLADYLFTEAQLDWIKKHYRHSANFLICYGYKPYNTEDCEDGARLVEQLMKD